MRSTRASTLVLRCDLDVQPFVFSSVLIVSTCLNTRSF